MNLRWSTDICLSGEDGLNLEWGSRGGSEGMETSYDTPERMPDRKWCGLELKE